ncbi:MAG: SDR family NAD(P)-dependent oxidoreductase [Pseudomonadota bacterium]
MFENQVVWITGASSGIGEAYAEAFRAEGARLILSGRRRDALEALAARLGGAERCAPLAFEATAFEALPEIVAQAEAAFGRIDVLVNNAGVSQRSLAQDTAFEVYRRVIDIDLMAPIALTQLAAPGMRARGSGRIIAVSSIAGKIGAPLRTAYCAAKHGVFGYFDALRAELSGDGIEVHVVAPGSVKTDIARNAMTADGAARGESDPAIEAGMAPSEVARITLAQIKRGKREIIIAKGRERLIERLRRYAPEFAFNRIAAMVRQGYVKSITGDRG